MISFAITTHNEGAYISDLLNQLVPYCASSQDEIIVLDDNSDDELTRQILKSHAEAQLIKLYQHALGMV
jgi:glycosyltransferase involved in cell wall biosynthesis